MNNNIIFQESSGFNALTVIFFGILILFLPLGLSMFSLNVRSKLGYEREKSDYRYHLGLFIVVGIVGIFCMNWKMNKVDSVELKSQEVILKGYFGNEIASFSRDELSDVRPLLSEGRRSTEADVYVVVIYAMSKEYYTNYLYENEASALCIALKTRVMKQSQPF